MKYRMFCLLLLFYFLSAGYGNDLDYYPLQNGNAWQYLVIVEEYQPAPYYNSYYEMHTVIKDTLLGNGKIYKAIRMEAALNGQNVIGYYYERVDSATGMHYRYDEFVNGGEFPLDSLFASPGDTFISCRGLGAIPVYCDSLISESLFGVTTESKIFRDVIGLNPLRYKLSRGFGLSEYQLGFDFGYEKRTLIYALIDGVAYGTPFSIAENPNNIPENLEVLPAYPNPFNAETRIEYVLKKSADVRVQIFTVDGRKISERIISRQTPGRHFYHWQAESVASGVYLVRVAAGNSARIQKVVLIK
ncbi:MAG: hypothetical protein Kow0037_32500 [Calditrichia bacterium]